MFTAISQNKLKKVLYLHKKTYDDFVTNPMEQ